MDDKNEKNKENDGADTNKKASESESKKIQSEINALAENISKEVKEEIAKTPQKKELSIEQSLVGPQKKGTGQEMAGTVKEISSANPLMQAKDKLISSLTKESSVDGPYIKSESLPAVKENITEIDKIKKQKVNPIMGIKKSIIRPLRTYKDDIVEAVRRKKASLVTITAAEQKARAKKAPLAPEKPSSEKSVKLAVIAISIMLVIAGISSIVFFYFQSQGGVITKELGVHALVFSESEGEFDTTELLGARFMNQITLEKNSTDITLNTFKHIYFTEGGILGKSLISASDFLNLLQVHAPDSLLRSLETEFMFGLHAFNKIQPFLILKTRVFDTAFAGMLNWEEAMSRDLSPLFGPHVNRSIINIEQGNTAPTIGSAIFSDTIIKSRDARVLLDERGNIALLYSFLDKNTIIITTNTATFEEIFIRLSSTRILR